MQRYQIGHRFDLIYTDSQKHQLLLSVSEETSNPRYMRNPQSSRIPHCYQTCPSLEKIFLPSPSSSSKVEIGRLSLSLSLSLSQNMANTSLQSLHHPLLRRHNPIPPLESLPTTLFLKPTNNPSPSTTHKLFTTFSLPSSPTSSSSSYTPTSTTSTISFDLLQQHLSSQNFRQADEETRRLLIVLAGDAAEKRGYVFFSEAQFISEADLLSIDSLWREHSSGRFGYSVQKRIWEKKAKRDFTKFFLKVGWMKKLDTEMEQYNYRAFPDEFMWELKDETPEGHLPLTNALRGTQLLNSILTHPAFKFVEEKVVEEGEEKGSEMGVEELRPQGAKPMIRRSFKTDYSF